MKITKHIFFVACILVAVLSVHSYGPDAAQKNIANSEGRIISLPKLLDLGAGKCIPCKMMEPILEELKVEYSGKFDVEFIDVWKDRSAGSKYGIRVIPTQIFFNADGKELYRHEGFYSKEEIIAKWKDLGINF